MSIKENLHKIKDAALRFVRDDHLFIGLLILLVGVGSFGLGRLSVGGSLLPSEASARIYESQTAGPVIERMSSTSYTATDEPKPAEEVGGMYVGSKNSDKYHLPWCSGAKRIKEENKVWFESQAAAEQAGYSPASNCPGI